MSPLVYISRFGATIDAAAAAMAKKARKSQRPVICVFSGIKLRAVPGDTKRKVVASYMKVVEKLVRSSRYRSPRWPGRSFQDQFLSWR